MFTHAHPSVFKAPLNRDIPAIDNHQADAPAPDPRLAPSPPRALPSPRMRDGPPAMVNGHRSHSVDPCSGPIDREHLSMLWISRSGSCSENLRIAAYQRLDQMTRKQISRFQNRRTGRNPTSSMELERAPFRTRNQTPAYES